MDRHGAIDSWNRAAEALLGWTSADILGRSLETIMPEPYRSEHVRYVERYLRTGVRRIPERGRRVQALRKDGALIPVQVHMSRIRSAEPEPRFLGVLSDRSHEEELEEGLRRAHKLEALGTLAGGIAHDFNNVLHGILVALELAAEGVSDTEHLEQAVAFARRGADLVEQIINFTGRDGGDSLRLFDPLPVLRESIRLLEATLPPAVSVVSKLAVGPARLYGSPSHLHQLLLNLGTNGAQAIAPATGELRIEVDSIPREEGDPDEWLRIRVDDSGPGVPVELRERVFDPFFTTRAEQGGTGLGLAIVDTAVRRMGGRTSLQTSPAGGARAEVLLPKRPAEGSPPPTPYPPERRGLRVLVVDDEPLILNSLRVLLRRMGHEAVAVADAEAALVELGDPLQRFDLLLTDHLMPGMLGTELAEKAVEVRPGLRVLLTSGHLPEEVPAGVEAVLPKPFEGARLAEALAPRRPPAGRPGTE